MADIAWIQDIINRLAATDGTTLIGAACALAALVVLAALVRRLAKPRLPLAMTARVVWVADGDTIVVRRNFLSRSRKIRLLGIDAPETEQDYGRAAKAFLLKMVHGRRVRIRALEYDRYGRWVARVHLEKQDVCLAMVRAGFAWPYWTWFKNLTAAEQKAYNAAAESARRGRRGLWAANKPEPPWEWRRHRLWPVRLFDWLRRLLRRLFG